MWRLDVVPKRIYVAAPMTEQGTAARLTLQLIDAGFDVTSRWLRKDFSDRPSQDDFKQYAGYEATWGLADMEDVATADTIVILAEQPSTHGGFHFELGYFLGLGKTNVVVVGNRPNVFFFTQHVRWKSTVAGLVEWLKDSAHGTSKLPTINEMCPVCPHASVLHSGPNGECRICGCTVKQ
jgi:hypothetical protein